MMVFPVPQYLFRRTMSRAKKASPKGSKIEVQNLQTGGGAAFFLKRTLEKKSHSGLDMTRPVFWDNRSRRWVG